MGLHKIKKLKGGSKAEKWKKGQSCVSNPTISKHREAARQGFFQKIKNSPLTEEALVKHVTALGDMPSGNALSIKSLAMSSNTSFALPSVMSSAKISIGYAPVANPVDTKNVFDLQKEMELMSVKEDDLKSQAKTFASRFTTCSIPAFENFFDQMKLSSEHQVKMLSFHTTIQKIIKERQDPETSLSYFVGIIELLSGIMDEPNFLAAGLALLARVIKFVPMKDLRVKYQEFGELLNKILKDYQDSNNFQLITHVLGSMSILLRAQPLMHWHKDNQIKTWLKNILAFTLHEEAKIRKSGQYNVSAVLKGSQFMVTSPLRGLGDEDIIANKKDEDEGDSSSSMEEESTAIDEECLEIHPAADLVADFLVGQLQGNNSTKASNKKLLHMLVFTRQVIMALPKRKLQDVVKRLFSLVSLGSGLINTSVMHALQSLCIASPPDSVLPMNLLNSILNTLTKHTPGMSSAIMAAAHDSVAVKAWSTVVTEAVCLVLRKDVSIGLDWAAKWFKAALVYWQSDNVVVLSTMEETLSSVIGAIYDSVNIENSETHKDKFRNVLIELETALSFQYQSAWPCIFRLLGQCYSELGLYYPTIMMPSLKTLCEMMSMGNVSCEGDLEKAIGMAIQGVGVEALLECAPVSITGDITTDEKNLWVLPILRKYVRGSRLLIFYNKFVPLAMKCYEVISDLEKVNTQSSRKLATYKTIRYQLWALLPSFAKDAPDVEESQDKKIGFAQKILELIARDDNAEFRIDAMAALRNMIASVNNSTGKLAKNSKNYLPALSFIYKKEPRTSQNMEEPNTVDNSHRLAALATITTYVKITPQKICNSLMDDILEKLRVIVDCPGSEKCPSKECDHGQRMKSINMHLARSFVSGVSPDRIHKLYTLISPFICPSDNTIFNFKSKRTNFAEMKEIKAKQAQLRQDQKAAYRVLENILLIDSPGTNQFINEHLVDLTELLGSSVSKVLPNCRAARLHSVKIVLEKITEATDNKVQEAFLRTIVQESIKCSGRKNSTACRKAAFDLLTRVPAAMHKMKPEADDATCVRECMKLMAKGLEGRPQQQANTIIAITAYTYLSKDNMPVDVLQQGISKMCDLVKSPSREVAHACLSYIKGIVSIFPVPVLGTFVEKIMNGIVGMAPDPMRKYRLKTKSILARLMRKFGDDFICQLVPEKQVVLHKRLRNLRKEASRLRRQKEAEEQEESDDDAERNIATEKTPTSLEEILAEIDPDLAGADDEDGTNSDGKNQKRHRQSKVADAWIVNDEDSEDEILDFLGPNAAQAIMTKKPRVKKDTDGASGDAKKKNEEDRGFPVDASGKLVITEEKAKSRSSATEVDQYDLDEALNLRSEAMTGKIKKRRRRQDSDEEDDDDSIDLPLPKRSKGGKNNKIDFDYGKEFRSKKAKGDVMKKGTKQQPYAYISLSKERLNKRKKAKYEGQFKMVVKGAKKGVKQGTKTRKSGKNKKYLDPPDSL